MTTDANLAAIDEILTTTRSVRLRLDFDRPIARTVINECLDIALQAPTSSNRQDWRFIVVTDPDIRAGLAACYRAGHDEFVSNVLPTLGRPDDDDPTLVYRPNMWTSITHLREHIHRVPVMLVPCALRRAERDSQAAQASLYGSIAPATWSFMLAARARGLGTCWTTLHLRQEERARELLGLPDDVTQAALIPVAYFSGTTFKRGARLPVAQVAFDNRWGAPRT